MSTVSIATESIADFHAGHGTVGTAEAKISSVAFPIRKFLVIRADSGNTSVVMVGTPGDAANGFALAAGQETPPLYIDSTDKVRVVGGAASQAYSWLSN